MVESFASRWTDKDTNGCHLWFAERTSKGFAKFTFHGEVYWADRFAWEMENKVRLSLDKKLRHTCGRASCVNPFHMEVIEQPIDLPVPEEKKRQKPLVMTEPPESHTMMFMLTAITKLTGEVATLRAELDALKAGK